jgi:hypothetical protein
MMDNNLATTPLVDGMASEYTFSTLRRVARAFAASVPASDLTASAMLPLGILCLIWRVGQPLTLRVPGPLRLFKGPVF